MTGSVAIIGGGVAGIAAGVALAEQGLRVQLFEKRPLLGGRASSFLDRQTGMPQDECQHGTMRCCTNLADLLERLGVHHQIEYFDRLEFLDGEGRRSVIKGCGLPAPAHTSLSFLTFRSLTPRDKVGIGRAMLAMLQARPDRFPDRYELEDIGTWLRKTGQTEQAVRRFWRPILVSACNEEPERISCRHAFKLFRDGFLLNPHAFHFGVPRVPLGTLYTEPTLQYIHQRGGCVRTRTLVDQIHFAGGSRGQVTGLTLLDGEHITADYYISGLQFDLLLKLLPDEITTGVPYWENLPQIELAPIIGIHLWFDRPLDCPPALAVLDRDIEWIFNKNQNYALPAQEGAYLSMVISASQRFSTMPKEELVALALKDVHDCLPEAKTANVARSLVVKWPKATIAPKPGVEALRPDQRSPLDNFYVAGEWTQTGWPSTMEGAARSGYRAAEYILACEGKPRSIVVPDLPVTGLARFFAR